VRYWHNLTPGRSAQVHQRQVLAFMDANPAYAVEVGYIAGADKLAASLASGPPPDAVRFDRFLVATWAAKGMLADLTEPARRDGVAADRFLPEAWLEASYEERLYAVPFDTDLRGLYYNKRHFREAGLDPNKPPTTIAELDGYAEKLTRMEGARYTRLGFIPWFKEGSLYTWAWVFGGELYDRANDRISLDAPRVVAALEWMTSYARKLTVGTVDRLAAGFDSGERDPLVSGLASMVSDGDWMVEQYLAWLPPERRADWDVVPYPRAEGGPELVTWGGGWSTIVPKIAREQDGAWAIARYLGVDSAATWAVETTHLPVYLPAYDDLARNAAKFDPRWRTFWPLRSAARFRPSLPVGQELWDAQARAVESARHLEEEPAAVLARLNRDVQRAYAAFKR